MERTKLKPFVCYFCHKQIENDTEMGHTSVCAQVLTPCQYKCGSYVPRSEIKAHLKECPNVRKSKSMTRLPTVMEDFAPGNTSSLDRHKSPGNFTKKEFFDPLRNEIYKISTRLDQLEHGKRELSNGGNSQSPQNWQDLEKIRYHLGIINEWKKSFDMQLDVLKNSTKTLEQSRQDIQTHFRGLQQKIGALDQLHAEFRKLQEDIYKERDYNHHVDVELAQKIEDFYKLFSAENFNMESLWKNQSQILDKSQNDINLMKGSIDELKAKNSSLVFDVKGVLQSASESAEKLEIQQRQLEAVKKDMEQLKLDLEILEGLAGENNTFGAPLSCPGHLIWKISNFGTKMTKAKEAQTVLKSSTFYTHDFGYRIKVLVYLNGLNKWKDRYTLIALHVLKGEFDPLLKWPCVIEGVVTLRDLESPSDPKNVSKFITAKRQAGDEENEDPQESSSSYIFIPHSTLTKSRYLQNDSVFLEIKIDQNRKLSHETNL